MKYLLLSLLFCPIALPAQDWPVGTKWLYEQFDYLPDNLDEYILFEVEADTVVDNQKLLVLREYFIINTNTGIVSYKNKTHLMQKNGGRVLFKKGGVGPLLLLYDFNAKENDTIRTYYPEVGNAAPLLVKVDSVRFRLIDGVNWKHQYVSTIRGDRAYSFTGYNVADIGNDFFIFPTYGAVDPPPGGRLLCFNNGVVRYSRSNSCDMILPTQTVSEAPFHIYPNPSAGQVYVEWAGAKRWELFSAAGQKVLSGEDENTIDLSGLPSGPYWLFLFNQKERMRVAKILKTN
jgi:Secretion system C-terminal sorting domain